MRYSEILQRLYSNDLNKIISVLQKSIYSTELNKKKDGIIAVHTGFTFVTHKGKLMEVIVCFNENSNEIIIVRQNRADWNYRKIPLINGLKLFGDDNYFDRFYPLIFAEIFEENNDYNLHGFEVEDPLKYLDIKLINEVQSNDSDEVIKSIKIKNENNELIFECSLQRNYEKKIYFDGNNFRQYILDKNNYKDNNQYDDYEKRPSYEDWLNNEFGDDAETAYWNNE